ncbi:kinase-like protein [Cylindrobasidium torrendii FP15055 ss-10]|uniref:non-specific serine/threonine protein kinase n=1 Tax=Cylindrobasidium torrendii FP15055 ss-10 TaxID=1314674 RepID=A0A0D7BPG6_9AGAR|nr:kinase-like protein [Cylindrobasidium torrendii FP15055 ss-10]
MASQNSKSRLSGSIPKICSWVSRKTAASSSSGISQSPSLFSHPSTSSLTSEDSAVLAPLQLREESGISCPSPSEGTKSSTLVNTQTVSPAPKPTRLRAGPIDVELIRQIGSGTYGSVILARSNNDGSRLVAVKAIPKSECMLDGFYIASDVEEHNFVDNIKCEARALLRCSKARSPFLPQAVEFAQDYRFFYFVMDAYPMDLSDLLEHCHKRGTILPQRLWFAQQMVCAVFALHKCGLAHLDLKPANVMIKHNGYLCLIDFGLATTEFFLPCAYMGTRGYCAPEVIPVPGARHFQFDTQCADVFSVGQIILDLYLCPARAVDLGDPEASMKAIDADMLEVVTQTMRKPSLRPDIEHLVSHIFEDERVYNDMTNQRLVAPYWPTSDFWY